MSFVKFLVVLAAVVVLSFFAAPAAKAQTGVGTQAIAMVLNELEASRAELQVEKQKLLGLLRAQQLRGNKRYKAIDLESSADLYLADMKQLNRQFQKLQNKIVKRELLGQSIDKLEKVFVRIYRQHVRVQLKSAKIRDRISGFVLNNTIVPANFRGAWNTNFGRIVFAQFDDGLLTGTYYYNGGGTIRGKVNGNVAAGTYVSNGGEKGTFRVEMIDEGKLWAGRYKSRDGNAKGPWTATKA